MRRTWRHDAVYMYVCMRDVCEIADMHKSVIGPGRGRPRDAIQVTGTNHRGIDDRCTL